MGGSKVGFHVADEYKEEYVNILVGRTIFYDNVANRKEDVGIKSESTVVYVSSDGKHHDIDMSSLESVEEQLGRINA